MIRVGPYVCLLVLFVTKCLSEFGSTVGKRMIGGTAVHNISEFPYHAILLGYVGDDAIRSYYHACGGVIVHPNYILTAAHCFFHGGNKTRRNIIPVVGTHDVRQFKNHLVTSSLTIHFPSRFNINYANIYDIALIKMDSPINLNNVTRIAAALPNEQTAGNTGQEGYITGHGRSVEVPNPSPFNPILNWAKVTVQSKEKCEEAFNPGIMDGGRFCAGSDSGSAGSCYGDSGGGFVRKFDQGQDKWVVVGIASFLNNTCAKPGNLAGYTRVFSYKDWINSIITRPAASRLLMSGPIVDAKYSYKPAKGLNSQIEISNVNLKKVNNLTNFPYYVQLMSMDLKTGITLEHRCSGVVLSAQFILTSGRCLRDENGQSVHTIRPVVGRQGSFYFERIVVRPFYSYHFFRPFDRNIPQHLDDIALIRLNRTLTLDENISAIEVLSSDAIQMHQTGTTIGFHENGAVCVLKQAELSIELDSFCEATMGRKNFISGKMFCAVRPVCSGDLGAPFVLKSNGKNVLFGIEVASYPRSNRCLEGKELGVFYKISSFVPWMKDVMQNSVQCLHHVFTHLMNR